MIKKNIKLGIAAIACAIMIAGNPNIALASEANQENVIVDEADTVDAEDTYVGVHDGKVMLNEKNFPDKNFREILEKYADSKGNIIIDDVKSISVYRLDGNIAISDITGIEYFTAFEQLDLREQKNITNFDATSFPELTSLNLEDGNLESLNVKNNLKLSSLSCENNKLKELDVTNNTKLQVLSCGNNMLTKLDLNKNTALRQLDCSDNDLGKLDLTGLTNLISLGCDNCNLNQLDLSNFNSLDVLSCSDNNLKTLDISMHPEIRTVNCYNNELFELKLGNISSLQRIDCRFNKLTSLDLSDNKLIVANCEYNPIKILNITNSNSGYICDYAVSVDYSTLEKLICSENDMPQLRLFVDTVNEYNDISKICNYEYALVDDVNYDKSTNMYKVDDKKSTKYGYEAQYGEFRIYPGGNNTIKLCM